MRRYAIIDTETDSEIEYYASADEAEQALSGVERKHQAEGLHRFTVRDLETGEQWHTS